MLCCLKHFDNSREKKQKQIKIYNRHNMYLFKLILYLQLFKYLKCFYQQYYFSCSGNCANHTISICIYIWTLNQREPRRMIIKEESLIKRCETNSNLLQWLD